MACSRHLRNQGTERSPSRSDERKVALGAELWVASPFGKGEGGMRVDSCSCCIQTSKPLTFILSPFVRGEAKNCGRRITRRSSVIISRFRMWFSLRVAICRSRIGDDAPRDNLTVALPEAIAIVRNTRVLPYQHIECFHQARLVRITHGRLAIWLDPFGMLDPQVVMNLLPQICVGMELVKHNLWSVSSPWCHGYRVSE